MLSERCRGCYLLATCPARVTIPSRYRDLIQAGATPWEAVEQVAEEKRMTTLEVYAAIEKAAGKL